MTRRILVLGLAAIAIVLVSACTSHVQTTSGRAYLEKYPVANDLGRTNSNGGVDTGQRSIDARVRTVAAVEPTLRFPARIGLARIHNAKLSGIPPLEADAWMQAAERMGPTFGTFVPVSRLVAEMVTTPWDAKSRPSSYYDHQTTALHRVMEKIRLGAARQHLDAVLVYEVYGESEQHGNLAGALNFTIIGAFMLPGESVRAKGFASALLVDVRNGYPYGTVRKVLTHEEITPSAGSSDVRRAAQRATTIGAAVALVPEVEKMMEKLRASLAKLEAAAATKRP